MPGEHLQEAPWLSTSPPWDERMGEADRSRVLFLDEERPLCSSSRVVGPQLRASGRRHWRVVLGSSLAVALIVSGAALFLASDYRAARSVAASASGDVRSNGDRWSQHVSKLDEEKREWRCGIEEDGIDYWTRQPTVWTFTDATSVDDCREKCFKEGGCMVWTYGKPGLDLDGKCFLKKLEQGEIPISKPGPGVVSGSLPCDMELRRSAGSLFCYALVRPGSYEQAMVAMLYREKASIFECERSELYSNQVIWIAPGITTRWVDTALKCDFGGEFGTALNNDIFLNVWAKVISDQFFKDYDWTVKADPDAVFFPDRLRKKLPHYMEAAAKPEGVIINNCKFGMHGPLEVLSKNAVALWGNGTKRCLKHFEKICGGDCKWGEDMFIDQCLWKVLGVHRVDDWDVLTENHCIWDPARENDWEECEVWSAAFHPFKTEESYLNCMHKARKAKDPTASDNPPVQTVADAVDSEAKASPLKCPKPEMDVDLVVDEVHVTSTFQNVPTWDACCAFCHGVAECKAWVWKDNSCVILDFVPTGEESFKVNRGTVSGTPPWRPPTSNHDIEQGLHIKIGEYVGEEGTIFCFSVMANSGAEPSLVATQAELKAGIFGCDKAAIFSNVSREVAPGVWTHVVKADLTNRMNARVFIAVWKAVVEEQWFKVFDWTVKVELETVFFAHRLPAVLKDHMDAGYISSCAAALHSPLEILSRAAMNKLANDYAGSNGGVEPYKCVEGVQVDQIGEDNFLDDCLGKVLKLEKAVDTRLLCEPTCDCNNYYWCTAPDHVSFYPFGQSDLYKQCLANALFTADHFGEARRLSTPAHSLVR